MMQMSQSAGRPGTTERPAALRSLRMTPVRSAAVFVVPVDFSPASLDALRAAGKLAERMDATITLLHVRPISDVRAALDERRDDLLKGPPRSLAGKLRRHYKARLERAAALVGA